MDRRRIGALAACTIVLVGTPLIGFGQEVDRSARVILVAGAPGTQGGAVA